MTTNKRPAPWSDIEIDACIGAYLLMRAAAELGNAYNKAAIIRELQTDVLAGRSRGSIEAKFMNVSAALAAIGREDLSMSEHGYRPLANMQKALKDRTAELVRDVTITSLIASAEAAVDA